ncbi:hypothetical protein [Anaerosalibacter massiliensis]|uniref:Uncharacterized protein n=1 Tax=Anaerosalibacter massiliensis TaxID=1347392 RepID=A0A9X2MFF9_9FIRM|nr:hypothetical protein [Anaerosalibacter massiliensis]MCR2044017.1 hypothetical protein [Anaerosalibacter massiliensis]
MKKFVYITIIIGVLFTINGCGHKVYNSKVLESKEIEIGVVETTASEYKSIIHWYDGDLNKVSEQKLSYAMLGSAFHNPVYYDNEIYMIPQGLGNKKDSKKVISFNKKDLSIKEFSFNNIALNDVAVSGDYIYTINTLNGDTHICRLNKTNNTVKELIIEKEYISGFTAVKGKIYAFSSNLSTSLPKFYLYIYDENLELLDKKDITQYGTSQYKFMNDDDYLYAGVMMTKEEKPSSIILKISLDTNEIETIDTNQEVPNDILQYKNKIIVTNHDLVINQGTKMTILDKNNEDSEVIDLNNKTEFAGIIGNMLVITNQEKVSLYDIEKDFKLIKETNIEKDDDCYISSIILLK